MTRREQIIQHIIAAVNAANVGAAVQRSRTAPVSREESPLIVVEPSDDQGVQNVVPKTDWTLTLLFTLCIRGGNLEVDADPIIQNMHAAIMADLTQGGLAMDTQPNSVRWKFADSDAGACDIECEYRVQYRTSQSDLTTP